MPDVADDFLFFNYEPFIKSKLRTKEVWQQNKSNPAWNIMKAKHNEPWDEYELIMLTLCFDIVCKIFIRNDILLSITAVIPVYGKSFWNFPEKR